MKGKWDKIEPVKNLQIMELENVEECTKRPGRNRQKGRKKTR